MTTPEPLFAIVAYDRPGAEPARLAARDAHFSHIESVMDAIAVAGPMRDAEGRFVGSIFIIRAASADAARDWLAADPYFKADIWASIDIRPFTAAAGTWIGGAIWR